MLVKQKLQVGRYKTTDCVLFQWYNRPVNLGQWRLNFLGSQEFDHF